MEENIGKAKSFYRVPFRGIVCIYCLTLSCVNGTNISGLSSL